MKRMYGRMSVLIALLIFLPRLSRKELKFGKGVGSSAPSFVHPVSYRVALVGFHLLRLGGIFLGCGILGGNNVLMVSPPSHRNLVIISASRQYVDSFEYPAGAAGELFDGSLKLRYCVTHFSKRFPPRYLPGLVATARILRIRVGWW